MKMNFTRKCLLPVILLGILVGTYNGRIAVWKDDDPEPFRVFPCPICLLPQEEQIALRNGIRIENMQDVYHFLENFMG